VVECQLPKLDVAGSIPVSRSTSFAITCESHSPDSLYVTTARIQKLGFAFWRGILPMKGRINQRDGLKPQKPVTLYQSS
jgi:hypothetical protein